MDNGVAMKKVLCIGLILLVCACQQKGDKQISPEIAAFQGEKLDLNDALLHYPNGLVSSAAPLDFEFKEPVIPRHFIGTELDESPVSFEPRIKGKAQWLSETNLVFKPADFLPAGKTINGVFKGKTAFGADKKVNDFKFSFKVAEQEVISFDGDFVAVPDEDNKVIFEGKILFSQPVDAKKVEDDIDCKGSGGKLKFTVTPGEAGNAVSLRSSAVKREKSGKNFNLTLPGKYTADNKSWEQTIILPGINVFRVITHADMTDPEADQYSYGFRFNDPIRKNIDLSGFITLAPALEFSAQVNGKYLLVSGNFIPGQEYKIKIAAGFPSVYGTKLTSDFEQKFYLSNIKPEIQWLSSGIYLPTDNKFKLQFKSVNVAKANLTVYEVLPQNLGFFLQHNVLYDKSKNYQNDEYYYYDRDYQDIDRVAVQIHKKVIDITMQKNKWLKSEIDLAPVFRNKKNSAFVVYLTFDENDLTGKCVSNRNNLNETTLYFEDDDYYSSPARPGYYYERGNMNKLLISSDIGLTLKKAGDGLHVFAVNVLDAHAAGGLKLKLYNFQNQLLEEQTTNTNGYAKFTRDEGSYIFGQDKSGIALIKLNHHDWELNNFDVEGFAGEVRGVNTFIYTDRGVYRPGDTIHLAAIIRMNKKNPPAEQPVTLTVYNAMSQNVLQTKQNCGSFGHVYFSIPTAATDPTGNWLAVLNVADQQFDEQLKVETVKPNRLKILVDVPELIEAPDLTLTGAVTSRYLFGAPAANLNTSIYVELVHKEFTAPKFSEYIFQTPVKYFSTLTQEVYQGPLDSQGRYDLNFEFDDLVNANGLLTAVLRTSVMEKGGNLTENAKTISISPFKSYVGIKNIFMNRAARFGDKYNIPVIVVDKNGAPLAGKNLKVDLYVQRDNWWWHYDERDEMDYKRSSSTFLISSTNITSATTPVNHNLTVEDYGRFLIEVTDLESMHQCGFFFYVYQWGGSGVTDEGGERNYLQVFSDKNVYSPGDVAKLTMETPGKGILVLNIEQGDKIIRQDWKDANGKRVTFNVPVTGEMIPNCYASVFLVQPHNQNSNDLPMRLYGIKTLYVEDKATHLPLTMTAPAEIKPREEFAVKVTSNAKVKATYTIAIVDEGLLDLTDFKTPKPWDYFFHKIRLGIQTLDNYDEIIGILFPDIDKYFNIGGDGFDEERMKRMDEGQGKRFIPVVLYKEPVSIKPGETVTTKFTMPNYIGSVRVMVIGAAGNSYTSLEQTIPVKLPLMVLPTVPRVARPGDIFNLPVSVFAMDNSINQVALTITSTDNLQIMGERALTMAVARPGEQDTLFQVRVGDKVGADSIQIKAVAGSFKTDYSVTLPILSANPFYTEIQDTMIINGQSVTFVPEKFGLAGTNQARLICAKLPDVQLDERLRYLIRYPYGCIEQTVSAAFPQLFLNYLIDVKDYQKTEITNNINEAIKRLATFQISRGFSYWPSSTEYNDWGTSYAGHFILEAKAIGYYIPDELFNNWLNSAKAQAKEVNTKNHRFQAYRLYLLALSGNADIGAMNLVRENYKDKLDPLSRKLLAAAYYLAGQKDAAKAVDTGSSEILDYHEMSGTYGSALRDRALMLYLCTKMNDQKTATLILKNVIDAFSVGRWYSTQETAMALLGISSYYKSMPGAGGMAKFRIETPDGKTQKVELSTIQHVADISQFWGKKITITSENNEPLFVSLCREGVPLDSRIKSEHQGIELARTFYNDEGYPITVDARAQGQPFWVVYTVKNIFGSHLEELALTSVFPAGWEIMNTRLNDEDLPEWLQKQQVTSGEYMDIRDDRVNWFFDLPSGRQMRFAVKLNPTFKGSYSLPPVAVEAMYSPEYFARIEGGKVVVK